VGDGPIRILVVGAGQRGTDYARLAARSSIPARVVAVAEPRVEYRERLAREHGIERRLQFTDWQEAAAAPKAADAVFITTQDALHADPACAFADLGYQILLEKPMAPDEAGCRRIVASAQRNGVLFAVCHVQRYTPYTRALKSLVMSGRLGDLVSLDRLEPVGWWHQAHSFVRGPWRLEAESSPMLLAKSCHDLDWFRHITGLRCRRVSSFGSLSHFRPERKPEGAASRCLDCTVEQDCPYSALKLYLPLVRAGHMGWPLDVLTAHPSEERILEALRTGPFGVCVYEGQNDVVDHQVVNLEFEGGVTASFTMTAFTRARDRQDRLFCTNAEVAGDGRFIEVFDFNQGQTRRIDTWAESDQTVAGGHSGGDAGVVNAFLQAAASGDPAPILSNPAETLESHLLVFAAERSRREGSVVDVGDPALPEAGGGAG
jgi:predicted dehydrogenase